ncbi:hypothetical protein [Acetobacter sp. DsW_063]|uniref:hypothetical protein n=1 Tax=Acetobacter sp. DsW_063 TaxID=1514894 RepID=UPI000A3610CE|nr:hypothetical protein [Acetobacter sp. DsW_063]OUJ16479.1 hypothetical protein HK28_12425 [Acetobacter sp. DsW_063]
MSWRPTARIVTLGGCNSLRLRGLTSSMIPTWPSTYLGSGNDYSVDFSNVLTGAETISSFAFGTGTNATQAWTTSFGNIVTMWASWTASGSLMIPVAVLSSLGATYQAIVSINVSATASILTPVAPSAPGETIPTVNSTAMDVWIESLPTSAPEDGGWWNNSGSPTFAFAS